MEVQQKCVPHLPKGHTEVTVVLPFTNAHGFLAPAEKCEGELPDFLRIV